LVSIVNLGPRKVSALSLGFWVRQNRAVDKDHVISKLRTYEQELRAAGIVHLRVFGSVARGEPSSRSDVDLLVEFDKSKHLTLVGVGGLQSRLADILGVDVDLSSEDWMREPIRTNALSEAVLAFRATHIHLRDIEECIDHISDFLGDMDFDTYRKDLKTKSTVERNCKF
jgi:uncharacterized protein